MGAYASRSQQRKFHAMAARGEVSEFKRKAFEADLNVKLDKLVREKRITPAQKPALFALMASATAAGDSMKFAIGDKKDLSMEAALMEFVSNGSKVALSEDEEAETDNEPKPGDVGNAKLAKAAKDYIAKMKSAGKNVSYPVALIAVARKQADTSASDEDGAE